MLLSVLFVCGTLVASSTAITVAEENTLIGICNTAINTNAGNLIPGLVRLSFHDCVGGCDGCVNTGLTESNGDEPNAGLNGRINTLSTPYNNAIAQGITISRADFWALCGRQAVQRARQNVNSAFSVPITMRYGRTDCSGGNNGITTSTANSGKFPDPRLGFADTTAWCLSTFGLNSTDCTALMGAHTLGRGRPGNSGYDGPWVRGPGGQQRLDNAYYRELNNVGIWQQEDVAPAGSTANNQRWQYSNLIRVRPGPRQNGNLLMLNTDMCLRKDISVTAATGEATAALNTFSDSTTAARVGTYAGNDATWIADFGRVFERMIEQGPTGHLTNLQTAT